MPKFAPLSPEARALRRHHRARLKAIRQFYRTQGRDPASDAGKPAGKPLGKVLATPAPCSCALCGNPRRYFGEAT
ncbi:MAG: hypothetical protein J0H09_02140, partial [Burkholderiales bacterium]|nr:hypothetical protein [Burkholderiales bacterium]